jgi:DNA polymerase-3 subunit beta
MMMNDQFIEKNYTLHTRKTGPISMKLVTPREAFLQHLQFAASVCPTRSTRPILMDVLVSVDGDHVQITATDGDVSVRRRYTADGVSGEGEAALPASTLLSAVRSMDSNEITIEQDDGVHVLTGGRVRFRLNGDDPTLFPSIPTLEPERGLEIPVSSFLHLCHRTMFSAAKEMGRYAFNGVLLEVTPEALTLVATDGRRLALARLEGTVTTMPEKVSVVVPVKGLTQIMRAQVEDDAMLRVEIREAMVAFSLPSVEIQAQLVEGEFPDYRAVIPKDGDIPKTVSIPREELGHAIQRASITAGDEGPAVALGFGENLLTVESRHDGVGDSRSEIEIAYEGEAVDLRFNPGFLSEYLKTLAEPMVTFRFRDRLSAGLFEVTQNSLYVIMPITS